MATAAVAAPGHVQQRPRRAPTGGGHAAAAAPTVPVHYPLTGFVRIEENSSRSSSGKRTLTPPPSKTAQRKTAAAPPQSKACSRWLYGVLLPGTLQLYARRTDYKRKAPPSDVIHIQVHTPSANESVFGFDHECVYIRSKATGHVVTVRIHQKKEIVRWVTALYYQSFSSDSSSSSKCPDATVMSASKHDSKRPPELHSSSATTTDATIASSESDATRVKRKSVSFQDQPEVLVLPRQSFDAADLFYSEREYVQFQQKGATDTDDDDDDTSAAGHAPPKKNLSRLMKSIYAKTAAKLKVSHKKSSIEELR